MPNIDLTDYASKLRASLRSASLVPGSAEVLIPDSFAPTTILTITFDTRAVSFGNLFRAGECRRAPTITFPPEANASPPVVASYLLMLVDPDAPTPEDPKFAFWRHWVLPGLRPTTTTTTTQTSEPAVAAETKTALTEYLGPGPKDDSTPHRYLFLLFKEPAGGLDLTRDDVGGEEFTQRRSFDPVAFVKAHDLKLVSVNWMRGAGDGWERTE